jgi:hypothetical protein
MLPDLRQNSHEADIFFLRHTVVPTNFRIAATARFIEANHPKHESFSESH